MSLVSLSSLAPVAEGGGRWVYFHPTYPECLLKVQKVRVAPASVKDRLHAFIARNSVSFASRDILQEMKAYTRARLRPRQEIGSFPAADIRGFVETDIGLALAVERIARSGELLGPTAFSLAGKEPGGGGNAGLSDEHLSLLNDFARQLFSWRVRVRDLNARNIVLGERGGPARFFLVDGLGDVTLVPLNTWSDTANRVELGRLLSITARNLGLTWDRRTRSFSKS